jgi:hypothetical protein
LQGSLYINNAICAALQHCVFYGVTACTQEID